MTAGRIQKIIFAHIKGKLVREGYVQKCSKAKVDQHQLRFWSDIIDHLASVVGGWVAHYFKDEWIKNTVSEIYG